METQNTAEAPTRRRTLFLVVFLLLLLNAATRWFYADGLELPGLVDGLYNFHIAENLFAGHGFTVDYVWNFLTRFTVATNHPSCAYLPPGMAVGLWGSFHLFGPTPLAGHVLGGILAAALICLTYFMGRSLFDDAKVGLYAALFLCFNTLVAYNSATCGAAMAFAVVANLALLPLARARRGARRPFIIAMAIGTVCPYLRPDGILIPLVIIGYFIWMNRRDPVNWKTVGLLLALWLLPQLPWAYRNYSTLGSIQPVSPLRTALLGTAGDFFSYGGGQMGTSVSQLIHSKITAFILLMATFVLKESNILFFFSLFAIPWILKQRTMAPFVVYAVALPVYQACCATTLSRSALVLDSVLTLYPFLACASVLGFRDIGLLLSTKVLRRGMPTLSNALLVARDAGMHAIIAVTAAICFYTAQVTSELPSTFSQLEQFYAGIESCLRDKGAQQSAPVFATDPFLLYHFTRRSAVTIPRDPNRAAIVSAATRYGARFIVVIEFDHTRALWNSSPYRLGGVIITEVHSSQALLNKRNAGISVVANDFPLRVPGLDISGFRIFEILPGGF